MEKLKKFWNETLGPDYEDEIILSTNSSDATIVALAKSDEATDNEWKKHFAKGGKKDLDNLKVSDNELNKTRPNEKVQTKTAEKEIDER